MIRFALLLSTCLLSRPVLGQKTESFFVLSTGLFSFQGASAEKTSQLNVSRGTAGYTNNPFGAKNGLSYGLTYQLQRITKGNFIIGFNIGYENLRSKTTINAVNGFDGAATFQESATGRSNLSNQFINGFPYVGYRIANQPVWVDVMAGIDVGYLFASSESGKATGSSGTTYTSSLDRNGIKSDVRPRLQLAAGYARLGVYAGYSYGLTNYRSGWVGGINECHSELIRFGVMYKLGS